MYPYVLCFCGRPLGDLYDAFKMMKIAKYIAAYADTDRVVDPNLLPICDDVQLDLSDIFEVLNIDMDCCRVRMNTQVEFKELY